MYKLDKTRGSSPQKLTDGLYVVMGNDSDALDFMYYYDNQGVLRGEVPIIGYRSHRLLFDDDGNILTLATDTNSDSVEDRVLQINKDTKKVTEVLDMEDLLKDYKEKCEKASDEDLRNSQYYVYMFNNNIGISKSQPNVSWESIGFTNDEGSNGNSSYYYKYFVDEEKRTFTLTDSFKVPYSGYVSSAQEIDGNTVIDSGIAGTFGEYDSSHTLIKSFKMEVERFIYRVYKYDFEEFYFA